MNQYISASCMYQTNSPLCSQQDTFICFSSQSEPVILQRPLTHTSPTLPWLLKINNQKNCKSTSLVSRHISLRQNLVDSPYSIVAPGTTLGSQTLRFPFSLLCALPPDPTTLAGTPVSPDGSIIKPGWVLYGNPYMIERLSC